MSTADGRWKRRELRQTAGGADTVGGRQKRRKLRRRQAEEAGTTGYGRGRGRKLRQTVRREVVLVVALTGLALGVTNN